MPKINPELYEEVSDKLESLGLAKQECGNKLGHEFLLSFNHNVGKVVVYKKGSVVFQGKAEIIEELKSIWERECNSYELNFTATKKNNVLVYYVADDEISDLRNEITTSCEKVGYTVESAIERYTEYRLIVTDSRKNKVTITQYQKKAKMSSSRLLLQGLDSEVWETVTNVVGSTLGMIFQTAVAKIKISAENTGDEVEVISVVTSQEKKDAELVVKEKLESCFNFLPSYDRDHIVSSQYMFISDIRPSSYFGFVSGTIRAFEGFIKKFVIELGAFTLEEVQDTKNWDMGSIYNGKDGVSQKVLQKLSSNPSALTVEKRYITNIVRACFKYRNSSFHNTPPAPKLYPTIESAETVHNELLDLMRQGSMVFGAVVR